MKKEELEEVNLPDVLKPYLNKQDLKLYKRYVQDVFESNVDEIMKENEDNINDGKLIERNYPIVDLLMAEINMIVNAYTGYFTYVAKYNEELPIVRVKEYYKRHGKLQLLFFFNFYFYYVMYHVAYIFFCLFLQ